MFGKKSIEKYGMNFRELSKKWDAGEIKSGDYIFAADSSLESIHWGMLNKIEKTDNPEAVYQNIVHLSGTIEMIYKKPKHSEPSGNFEIVPMESQTLGNPAKKALFSYVYFTCENYQQLKAMMEERGLEESQIGPYFNAIKEKIARK